MLLGKQVSGGLEKYVIPVFIRQDVAQSPETSVLIYCKILDFTKWRIGVV
jgi:hypothetical protein